MTVTAAGSATEVEVDATLVLTATPNTALNPQYYAIKWVSNDATSAKASFAPAEGATTTVTGVAANATAVKFTAEIMSVTYVNGVRTLVELDPDIEDDIDITVVVAGE